jgi:hypothetical protein
VDTYLELILGLLLEFCLYDHVCLPRYTNDA